MKFVYFLLIVFIFSFNSLYAQTVPSSSVKKIGARGTDLQVLGGLLADSVLVVPAVSDTSREGAGKRIRQKGSVLQYGDSLYYFDGKGFRAIGPGARGLKGDKGERGEAGAVGPKGETGMQGNAGPAGPKGETGDKGEAGPAGPTGPQGPAGENGERGPAGPAGPMGPTGRQGPKGEQGEQGVTGPAGAAGSDGATGAAGPKGDKGNPGVQGIPGVAGVQGARGPSGPAGLRGEKGPAGAIGPKGNPGPQGPAGPRGDKGDPSSSSRNIYNSDSLLKANRTLTLNNFKLYFKGTATDKGLVLKGDNVGIGVAEPLKNFHTKGSVRIEGETGKSPKNNYVLTATNTNGDAEWKAHQNIYSIDGTINAGASSTSTTSSSTAMRKVTIPSNTILRFVGSERAVASLSAWVYPTNITDVTKSSYFIARYGNSRIPKVGGDPSDLDYVKDKTRNGSTGKAVPNSTAINELGNLVIQSRDGNLVVKSGESYFPSILSAIPFVISSTAKCPPMNIYNQPGGLRYYSGTNQGNAAKYTTAPKAYTLKAMIQGNVLIEGGNLFISSDKRIKKVKGIALPSESVQRIKNLNVYQYQFKDTIAKGSKMMTGVIAQEVQKVLPDAVFTFPEAVVPDIFKNADSIKNFGEYTRVYLPLRLNPDSLKVGSEVEFILTNNNKRLHRKIISVKNNYIEVPYLCAENTGVFAYGSFVNDLLNLDYNQLFMENLNVTKYLLQQQEIQEQKMKYLEKELKEQKELLQKLLQQTK